MCDPANIDMTHNEMQHRLARLIRPFAKNIETEWPLPNGKIADIMYEVGQATVIIEVKTILKRSLIEMAYEKYHHYCDYLIIATPPTLEIDDYRVGPLVWPAHSLDHIGIWHVDWLAVTEARCARPLRIESAGRPYRLHPRLPLSTVIGSPACTVSAP